METSGVFYIRPPAFGVKSQNEKKFLIPLSLRILASSVLDISFLQGINQAIVQQLRSQIGHCIHSFCDIAYNRTSFYITGPNILDDATRLCKMAFDVIDFKQHKGSHPTLGVVDNVCFSPLGEESLDTAISMARSFSDTVHANHNFPVYYYGFASPRMTRLQNIRRSLGYFTSKSSAAEERIEPDLASEFDPHKGVMCVGAVPLIVNFNIRYKAEDSFQLVKQVTAAIRSHDVEALTLPHKEGSYEVACNLLNTKAGASVSDVLQKAKQVSDGLGLTIEESYTTAPTEEELLAVIRERNIYS